jgi:hypothetical protein
MLSLARGLMKRTVSYSRPGERGENQDAFQIRSHPANPDSLMVAIADGQGGRAGGGIAARLACRVCIEMASSYAPRNLTIAWHWRDILRAVDQAVHDQPEAGFTTLIAFCITSESVICGGSNGDSAVVLLNDKSHRGILTANQPKNPPVGSGYARFGTFFTRLQSPWTVLAMSDGVWKYTGWDPLFRIASQAHGKKIIESLRHYAALPTMGRLQDDFTLIVIEGNGNYSE